MNDNQLPPQHLPPQWQQRSHRQFSVLVIEDDDNFREFFCQLLEASGMTVFSAANGQLGLELFRRVLPKIVITDIIMPGTDGIEVIETIKRRSTQVPVIAMAGTPKGDLHKGFLSLALMRGADAVIRKPINMDELRCTINDMLDSYYPSLSSQQGAAEQ